MDTLLEQTASSDSEDISGQTSALPRRTPMACTQCRERKKKCQQLPGKPKCVRCLKREWECIVAPCGTNILTPSSDARPSSLDAPTVSSPRNHSPAVWIAAPISPPPTQKHERDAAYSRAHGRFPGELAVGAPDNSYPRASASPMYPDVISQQPPSCVFMAEPHSSSLLRTGSDACPQAAHVGSTCYLGHNTYTSAINCYGSVATAASDHPTWHSHPSLAPISASAADGGQFRFLVGSSGSVSALLDLDNINDYEGSVITATGCYCMHEVGFTCPPCMQRQAR